MMNQVHEGPINPNPLQKLFENVDEKVYKKFAVEWRARPNWKQDLKQHFKLLSVTYQNKTLNNIKSYLEYSNTFLYGENFSAYVSIKFELQTPFYVILLKHLQTQDQQQIKQLSKGLKCCCQYILRFILWVIWNINIISPLFEDLKGKDFVVYITGLKIVWDKSWTDMSGWQRFPFCVANIYIIALFIVLIKEGWQKGSKSKPRQNRVVDLSVSQQTLVE